jgi:hypothetical protein
MSGITHQANTVMIMKTSLLPSLVNGEMGQQRDAEMHTQNKHVCRSSKKPRALGIRADCHQGGRHVDYRRGHHPAPTSKQQIDKEGDLNAAQCTPC